MARAFLHPLGCIWTACLSYSPSRPSFLPLLICHLSFDRNALTKSSAVTQKLSANWVNYWSLHSCRRAVSPMRLQGCFLITYLPNLHCLVGLLSFPCALTLPPYTIPYITYQHRCDLLVFLLGTSNNNH